MNKEQITFNNLSPSLKTLVILTWALIALNAVFFILGFITGATT